MKKSINRIAKSIINQLIDDDEYYVIEYRKTEGRYTSWHKIRAVKDMFGQFNSVEIDIRPRVNEFTTTEDEFRIEKDILSEIRSNLSPDVIRAKLLSELEV